MLGHTNYANFSSKEIKKNEQNPPSTSKQKALDKAAAKSPSAMNLDPLSMQIKIKKRFMQQTHFQSTQSKKGQLNHSRSGTVDENMANIRPNKFVIKATSNVNNLQKIYIANLHTHSNNIQRKVSQQVDSRIGHSTKAYQRTATNWNQQNGSLEEENQNNYFNI